MKEFVSIETFLDRLDRQENNKTPAYATGIEYFCNAEASEKEVKHLLNIEMVQPTHYKGVKSLPELIEDVEKALEDTYNE